MIKIKNEFKSNKNYIKTLIYFIRSLIDKWFSCVIRKKNIYAENNEKHF